MKQKGGSQAGSDYPLGRMAGGKGQMASRVRWRLFRFSLEKLPFGARPNYGRWDVLKRSLKRSFSKN